MHQTIEPNTEEKAIALTEANQAFQKLDFKSFWIKVYADTKGKTDASERARRRSSNTY